MTDWPKIKSRHTIKVSPWMEITEREVEFASGTPSELYHAVSQQDYIAIVALTPDGRIPIVRQYRPALERFTWELPAGMVDRGESAADCAERELLEETGYPAKTVHTLGEFAPCTARLSNRIHSFFVETGARRDSQSAEPGIELRLVTPTVLATLIGAGEFDLQLHIGTILLAGMRGFIDLAPFQASKSV